VREEAAKAEREAAEREQARQEEMARLAEAEAQAKTQLEEERNRVTKILEQERAQAKARLAEEEARLKEEAERIKREAALKEAELERKRQAERERLLREDAELKARLAEEEDALKVRLAELEERMKERTDFIKRLEAADVEVKKAEVSQMTNRATSAAVRLETAENELDIISKRIMTFEKANMGKKYALQSKRAMADAKEYCGLLSDFFVRNEEHLSAEEELTIITKYRDLSNDAPAALVARLEDASEVPIAISKRFTFLLKYRARRNAIIVLSKLSARHPEDAVRRKCFAALNNITRSSTLGLLVVARCAALPNALMAMVEWASLGEERMTEDNAPWEAMELVHNLVSSRRMKRSEVLRRHLAGGLFGRCILAVVKLVPHIPSFQGMMLGTLWQLIRASGYDATLQNALVADGIIRHILDCKTYAKQNGEIARVFCGCALALAMNNESVQKHMVDKKWPARIVKILSLHQVIDYKGEFTALENWLSSNV
jgi:KaiC/GvpD/RAD55 family RecA-like ATPase